MNISYLSNFESLSIANWSGLEYNIAMALRLQGANVDFVGTSRKDVFTLLMKGKVKKLLYLLVGQRYLADRTIDLCKFYAREKSMQIKKSTDIIFSLGTSTIAFLETEKPIVFYTDATFAGIVDYYKEFSNLCKKSLEIGNLIERKALDRANLILFSSDWAAESAIRHYNVSEKKIKVLPFGSNLESDNTLETIKKIIDEKESKKCKLLFLGVDWSRKGGDLALEVTKILNELGLITELHVAGIKKLPFKDKPDCIIDHGFISKSTKEGMEKIKNLLMSCHFLILPTKADCTPVVFSEANSFGLPVISTNTGGIASIIKNGINGRLFNLDDKAELYAKFIQDKISKYDDYKNLAISSFNEYQKRLNWEVTGSAIMKELNSILKYN